MTTRTSSLHALSIEYLAPDDLIANPNNSRKHPRQQIKKLAHTMGDVGCIVPLLIDDANMIIAGHGRLLAARLVGLTTVPVVRVKHLTAKQKRAFMIADNKLGDLSYFDMNKLAVEFEFLLSGEDSFAIETTGFDIVEVDRALGYDRDETDNEPVELPAADATAVSQLGDLWCVGPHRILCGSCLDRANIARLFDGKRAGLVLTDPPYGVAIENNVSGLGATKHKDFEMGCTEMSDAQLTYEFFRPAFQLMADFAHAGAIAFVFIDWRHSRHIENAANGVFYKHKNTIVWVKSSPALGGFYKSQHEMVLAFQISRGPVRNNFGLGGKGRVRSNVWQYPGANTFRAGREQDLKDHPTVKNLKMCCDAILDVSAPGDIVFDPFLGSGTTATGAALTGRIGYGLELSPIFVDVILRRLNDKTGLVPKLEDGRTFAEVAADRSIGLQEAGK